MIFSYRIWLWLMFGVCPYKTNFCGLIVISVTFQAWFWLLLQSHGKWLAYYLAICMEISSCLPMMWKRGDSRVVECIVEFFKMVSNISFQQAWDIAVLSIDCQTLSNNHWLAMCKDSFQGENSKGMTIDENEPFRSIKRFCNSYQVRKQWSMIVWRP